METISETTEALVGWLDNFSQAVGGRDLEETIQLFSDAAEVSVWPSETDLVAGPDAVKTFFKSLYEQAFTISWRWKPQVISTIGDGAWLATDGEEIYRLGGNEQRYPYRVTAVFERKSDRWLCVHFHGSEPARHDEETAYAPTASPELRY